MTISMWSWACRRIAGLCLCVPVSCQQALEDAPAESADPGGPVEPLRARNIVFIMGDGMGLGHVRAGRIYRRGPDVPLTFESLPAHATFSTRSLSSGATDSAAAGTAFATGTRVKNGVISVDADGAPLTTILERAARAGKATGIITTNYVHDASPAAFTAHAKSRTEAEDIIGDIVSDSQPDIVFGGGRSSWSQVDAIATAGAEGYRVVGTADELENLGPGLRVLGLFSGHAVATGDPLVDPALESLTSAGLSLEANRDGTQNDPRLPQMALAAIERLAEDPDGFFLFIENEHPDSLCHVAGKGPEYVDALMPYVVAEVGLIDETVEVVLAWVAKQPSPEDTLVIVTADHDTCGLDVADDDFEQGAVAAAVCSTGPSHSTRDVEVWATGNGSESLSWVRLNTDLHAVMTLALFGLEE